MLETIESMINQALSVLNLGEIDFQMISIKGTYFVVVMLVTFVVQHLVVKGAKNIIHRIDRIQNASIFLNILRVIIWSFALILVLEPVFGIKPTAFVAGLGITSVIISLGLQDTVKNLIGGFNLMFTDVITIGDYVTIAGVTGTVKDLTWRHTVVVNRQGDNVVIPNSVLNTSSVIRLPVTTESKGIVDFTMEPGRDASLVADDILATIDKANITELMSDESMRPKVRFVSITPYGISGQIIYYAKSGIPFSTVCDKVVRAISAKEYFSTIGVGSSDLSADASSALAQAVSDAGPVSAE